MKTTIDIPEGLLQRAKVLAKRRGSTLRDLTCEGIELLLSRQPTSTYQFQGAVVQGKGLQREFQGSSWAKVRAAAYGDRE